MTAELWLPGAHVLDLRGSKGNDPFTGHHTFLGVILHVNESENGTSDAFFREGPPGNPNDVCPNFQVYKDGSIHQYLPFDYQPWCQRDGNYNYAAIETAGLHSEPLTSAQIAAIARIVSVYHSQMGMPLVEANTPGQRGLGTHQMGGAAWGGHPCPGTIRAGQRLTILKAAGAVPIPPPHHYGPEHNRAWPSYMKPGNYFGNINGPAVSHGGYYTNEQADVHAIQLQLDFLGYSCSGDPAGKFEAHTIAAAAAWQHKYMPGTKFYGQVWSDDWKALMSR